MTDFFSQGRYVGNHIQCMNEELPGLRWALSYELLPTMCRGPETVIP